MKERIENKNFKSYQFEPGHPPDICLLPNDYFCFACTYSVKIYNQNFKLMKNVNKINNKDMYAIGIAFNRRNELYISDCEQNCIYMMDFNLNYIKSFGKKGKGNDRFDFPEGLCCKNDRLYVCDYLNYRIQILSLDFEYIDTIQLNYQPKSIKISDSIIGIAGSNGTYFFDLNTKELKKEYPHVKGKINKIDSYFYVTNTKDQREIHCFDTEGCLKRELIMNEIKEWVPYLWDGCILIYNKYNNISGSRYEIFYSKF
jgi:hypothetical protein